MRKAIFNLLKASTTKHALQSNCISSSDVLHVGEPDGLNIMTYNLSYGCCEYLASPGNNNQDVIIPIPINRCFKNIKSLENKKKKIIEYLNYIKKDSLFNIEILNNEASNVINSQLIGNLLSDKLENADINFLNMLDNLNISLKHITLSGLISMFHSMETKHHKNFIKQNEKKILDKFSKIIITNPISKKVCKTYLLVNNYKRIDCIDRKDDNYKYKVNGGGIRIIRNNKIIDGPLNYEVITNLNAVNVKKGYSVLDKKIVFNNKNYNTFKIHIHPLYAKSIELKSLIFYIMKLQYKYILKNKLYNKNGGDKDMILNFIKYFDIAYKFLLNIDNSEPKNDITLGHEIKNNTVYVKINGSSLVGQHPKALLLNLTLIRYLFLNGYNHLPEIILNFKNNTGLSLYNNLFISSHFHRNTAYNVFNILNCRDSFSIGKCNDSRLHFFKYKTDKHICDNILDEYCLSIHSIFDSGKINVRRENKIRIYLSLEYLLLSRQYDTIIDFFNNGNRKVINKHNFKIVKCIDKSNCINLFNGDSYLVIKEIDNKYLIIDKSKRVKYYKKERFK